MSFFSARSCLGEVSENTQPSKTQRSPHCQRACRSYAINQTTESPSLEIIPPSPKHDAASRAHMSLGRVFPGSDIGWIQPVAISFQQFPILPFLRPSWRWENGSHPMTSILYKKVMFHFDDYGRKMEER